MVTEKSIHKEGRSNYIQSAKRPRYPSLDPRTMPSTHTALSWRFFRAGGFDQVRLDTASELLHIGELDQKLWVALSCPIRGTELDARTLALIDTDGDGVIRASELIAAVNWAAQRLRLPEVLAQGLDGVPLAAINDDDAAGAHIMAVARHLVASKSVDVDPQATITVAMAGEAQRAQAAQVLADWEARGQAVQVLGAQSAAAFEAYLAVKDKVEDWWVRCELAAFDARATDTLNPSVTTLDALGGMLLNPSHERVAALPLARVAADAALPLQHGLNPAWAQAMGTFRDAVITPLLGERSHLSHHDWHTLVATWQAYATWRSEAPDPQAVGNGTRELEQLARYVRDLMPLANNFVSFRDFYTRKTPAIFQVGTLYLDGRACELCVAVNDAAKHASLAALSRMYLVYVDCVRGNERMSVAAAFTAGDADQLMVGRNGVFYDRQGCDWNATIVKLMAHPISLHQAFWAPYKRLARLVNEQIQKVTADHAKASDARLAQTATLSTNAITAPGSATSTGTTPAKAATQAATGSPASSPASAGPTPFDVGKFAGIFAAIGLAVGALGTALASVMSGLFALTWWQMPLALAGLLMAVSGPAVVLAWFKLRSRNLGPILDANGWAINARARINIPFGTSLTQVARLPANAERSLQDPYAERATPWGWYVLGLVIMVALAAAWLMKLLLF